jgi:hypothetical protein
MTLEIKMGEIPDPLLFVPELPFSSHDTPLPSATEPSLVAFVPFHPFWKKLRIHQCIALGSGA